MVLPILFRDNMLVAAHEGLGHCGVRNIRSIIQMHFTWPSIAKDVTNLAPSATSMGREYTRKLPWFRV